MPKEAGDALRAEYPWLTDDDLQAYQPRGGGGGGGGPSAVGDADAPAAAAVPVPSAEDVAAELAATRERWSWDASDLHFYVRILAWNDSATCFARNFVKPWCEHYHWPKQKGSISQ